MNDYKLYIAGEFISSNEKLIVTNPYDNSIVGETYVAGQKELEKAILKAIEVKELMRELPSYKRYEILHTIANKISKKKNELAIILSKEAGKPLKHKNGKETERITRGGFCLMRYEVQYLRLTSANCYNFDCLTGSKIRHLRGRNNCRNSQSQSIAIRKEERS